MEEPPTIYTQVSIPPTVSTGPAMEASTPPTVYMSPREGWASWSRTRVRLGAAHQLSGNGDNALMAGLAFFDIFVYLQKQTGANTHHGAGLGRR